MALPDDVLADLDDRARLDVAARYDPAGAIVELVEYDPETKELVDRHMAEHAASEGAFPSTTDQARL